MIYNTSKLILYETNELKKIKDYMKKYLKKT